MFNPSWPSDTIWQYTYVSRLAQIMAWCLITSITTFGLKISSYLKFHANVPVAISWSYIKGVSCKHKCGLPSVTETLIWKTSLGRKTQKHIRLMSIWLGKNSMSTELTSQVRLGVSCSFVGKPIWASLLIERTHIMEATNWTYSTLRDITEICARYGQAVWFLDSL